MAQPPKDIQAKMRQMAEEQRVRNQLKSQYDAEMAKRYSRDMVPFAQWMASRDKPGMAKGGAKRVLPAERREANLAKFLEPSAEKRRMYHGTRAANKRSISKPGDQGIEEFKHGLRGMTFVSPDSKFANSYAGARLTPGALEESGWTPTMYPVHVQVKNPFDYENPEHIEGILPHLPFGTDYKWSVVHKKTPDEMRKELGEGRWEILEDTDVVEAVRNAGHDAMYMKENGVKNLGVFDAKKIKSAIGNRGTYDTRKADITKAGGGEVKPANLDQMRLELNKIGMHSPMEKAAMSVPRTKGTAQEFMTEMQKQPGFRNEELADRPIKPREGKMTKEEFVKHVKGHKAPQIDVEHRYAEDDQTHHDEYTHPGGENYREIFLKRPAWKGDERIMGKEAELRRLPPEDSAWRQRVQGELDELRARKEAHGEVFGGVPQHFGGEPGIVASLRVKDRQGPRGEKIYHIEEVQSDWHQQGRKQGYRDENQRAEMLAKMEDAKRNHQNFLSAMKEKYGGEGLQYARMMTEEEKTMARRLADMPEAIRQAGGTWRDMVPDAPHKKSWHELALKHALIEAVQGGYHGIAITPGEQQADRYDLSKQISSLMFYAEPGSESGVLRALDHHGDRVINETVPVSKLDDYVGKEAAKKLLEQQPEENDHFTGLPSQFRTLNGVDLKVGGEGMKGFYDKIVVDFLNKLGKKHGAQVGRVPLNLAGRDTSRDAEADKLLDELGVEVPKVKAPMLHYFPITESLRKQIKTEGLPQYAEGGDIE